MAKHERYNSFKYRIIGAATIFVILIILLPIIFHNNEEAKLSNTQNNNQSTNNGGSSFQSTIEPVDGEVLQTSETQQSGTAGTDTGEPDAYTIEEITMEDLNEDTETTSPSGVESNAGGSLADSADNNVIEDVVIEDIVPNEATTEPEIPKKSDVTATAETAAAEQTNNADITQDNTAAEVQAPETLDDLIDKHVNQPANQQTEQTAQQNTAQQPAQTEVVTQEADFSADNVAVGWIVQVGSFSEAGNAQRLINTLSSNGFQPQHNVVDANGIKTTRVWVGPYEKRVSASKAMEKVEEVAKIKPFIKAYP